jgi:signal transduction histidine kinase
MTGGVAHDFNNLLTIIIGSLSLLRRATSRDDKARERIDMMSIAAERASRLTKQLLAFARRQPLQPEIVNLGHLMREVLPLIRRAIGEAVTVECITAGGLWNTLLDASEFQSAVLNLSINARDAMPKGGKLTIEVVNAALDDAYAARHAEVGVSTNRRALLFAGHQWPRPRAMFARSQTRAWGLKFVYLDAISWTCRTSWQKSCCLRWPARQGRWLSRMLLFTRT